MYTASMSVARIAAGWWSRMISSLLEIMAVVGALELVVAVGEAILHRRRSLRWGGAREGRGARRGARLLQ